MFVYVPFILSVFAFMPPFVSPFTSWMLLRTLFLPTSSPCHPPQLQYVAAEAAAAAQPPSHSKTLLCLILNSGYDFELSEL
jgi:hypothetical protein